MEHRKGTSPCRITLSALFPTALECLARPDQQKQRPTRLRCSSDDEAQKALYAWEELIRACTHVIVRTDENANTAGEDGNGAGIARFSDFAAAADIRSSGEDGSFLK